MHGNENHFRLRRSLDQLLAGVKAVEQRHGDVEQDHVRLQFFG